MPNRYSKPHICQCLSRILTLRRTATVTISGDRRKTGEEFVDGVLGLARGLVKLGLRPGDVVAVSAYNSDLYLEWLLAVAHVGGILAPLNYRWSFEETRFALEAVRPVLLVVDESYRWDLESVNGTVNSLKWLVFMVSASSMSNSGHNGLTTEMLKSWTPKSSPLGYSWTPEGEVLICFTSGTTGKPKGVTISHTALIVQSLAKMAVVGYTEDDVYLHTAPLCHIGGISSAMAILMAGGCHVLMPKFESTAAIEAIERNHVTSFITVPTMMADLISVLRLKKTWEGTESVKKILNGGGSLAVKLLEDVISFFHNTKIFSAYGMTETCSSLTFMLLYNPQIENKQHDVKRIYDVGSGFIPHLGGLCVGKPAPHIEIKVHYEPGSSDRGRILTRGPHVMLGYWGQSSSMATGLGEEEWFDTGDVGQIDDDGNLWLIGRRNGRIKSGGENVYPEEVEAVLLLHPGIHRVVVVGLAHRRFGEMVLACIQLKEDWEWSDKTVDDFASSRNFYLTSEILKQHCRDKDMTGFKVPKMFILWRKPFPLTSTGKLRRDQVKIEATQLLQSLDSSL
ncbi:hypothetical protein Droror1_Dr00013886 [Drosera rotundifolia]